MSSFVWSQFSGNSPIGPPSNEIVFGYYMSNMSRYLISIALNFTRNIILVYLLLLVWPGPDTHMTNLTLNIKLLYFEVFLLLVLWDLPSCQFSRFWVKRKLPLYFDPIAAGELYENTF